MEILDIKTVNKSELDPRRPFKFAPEVTRMLKSKASVVLIQFQDNDRKCWLPIHFFKAIKNK